MVEKNPEKPEYERHKPEESTIYKLVQENWLTFQSLAEADTGQSLPDFVIREFDEFLRCGILANGFLRAKCTDCNHEWLVAFSCKRRGFCPSCSARRKSPPPLRLPRIHPLTPFCRQLSESNQMSKFWTLNSRGMSSTCHFE
ncbi:MAG: hypothetical protein C5B49_14940 [Bdellovibrio sp.]|nr:MAG: hypothetical protein C5B49_14940 [Bdellovibrio sp.]